MCHTSQAGPVRPLDAKPSQPRGTTAAYPPPMAQARFACAERVWSPVPWWYLPPIALRRWGLQPAACSAERQSARAPHTPDAPAGCHRPQVKKQKIRADAPAPADGWWCRCVHIRAAGQGVGWRSHGVFFLHGQMWVSQREPSSSAGARMHRCARVCGGACSPSCFWCDRGVAGGTITAYAELWYSAPPMHSSAARDICENDGAGNGGLWPLGWRLDRHVNYTETTRTRKGRGEPHRVQSTFSGRQRQRRWALSLCVRYACIWVYGRSTTVRWRLPARINCLYNGSLCGVGTGMGEMCR